ncbi:fucolectin-5-like [Babylonia areolata]|uniref:fucolectin-5-like n=1 Tax=Babylonia areolata TaxID=304850 RepID=UPI003FD1F48A
MGSSGKSRSSFQSFFCALWAGLILASTGQGLRLLTNVALNKPATMSSQDPVHGAGPQSVVDGDKSTHVSRCAHSLNDGTETRPDRWWRVDLQGLFHVHQVVITNFDNEDGLWWLSNFYILLDRNIYNSSSGRQQSSRQCLHHPKKFSDGATVTLSCSQPTAGRYVTLVIDRTATPLSFCEMAVLAVPAKLAGKVPRHSGKKATADVIKTTWARSVTVCITTCVKEPSCTAVNLQSETAATGETALRVCQLLMNYMPHMLQPENGWDFFELNNIRPVK